MTTDTIITFSVIGIPVLIAIGYFFTRWIFSIDKLIKLQEMQIELLKKIARQQEA